jgi:hypothetical protein
MPEAPLVSLPGGRRSAKYEPPREEFELQLPRGESIRVEGWSRDKRYTQRVRVMPPDGRAICVEGFRRGWFVWREDDPEDCAGGDLVGCLASVLGSWPDWPDWVEELAQRLYYVES